VELKGGGASPLAAQPSGYAINVGGFGRADATSMPLAHQQPEKFRRVERLNLRLAWHLNLKAKYRASRARSCVLRSTVASPPCTCLQSPRIKCNLGR
jgi:hypothetical protein